MVSWGGFTHKQVDDSPKTIVHAQTRDPLLRGAGSSSYGAPQATIKQRVNKQDQLQGALVRIEFQPMVQQDLFSGGGKPVTSPHTSSGLAQIIKPTTMT